MSTATLPPPPVQPPSSASNLPFARYVPRLTERARALLTATNLHFAGVALLLVLVLYLGLHLLFVWQRLGSLDAAAMDRQRVELRAAEVAAKPLRGLDAKLVDSTAAADKFYQQRLPYATSEVAAELGALAHREGVHWTRAQYAYNPVLSGGDTLTEVRIDASVSGDYRPIVQFINTLERDKRFFLIYSINLTGQQTGQVNLRLRLSTYLRAPQGDEQTDDVALPGAADASAAKTGAVSE
jgi:Tfp pilus assembly protein PilO